MCALKGDLNWPLKTRNEMFYDRIGLVLTALATVTVVTGFGSEKGTRLNCSSVCHFEMETFCQLSFPFDICCPAYVTKGNTYGR